MADWWYAKKGKKVGPKSLEELRTFFMSGKVGPETQVWRDGMEAWSPIHSVTEMEHFKLPPAPPEPPPVPEAQTIDALECPIAGPWRRFFARLFDLWVETLVVSFGLAFGLSYAISGFADWINKPGMPELFSIMCVPVALFVDAGIARLFGNTPGKALLGIYVLDADKDAQAERLDFKAYLKRNLGLWAEGMFLSLPLLNLFAFSIQYKRVKNGNPATYDQRYPRTVRMVTNHWLKTAVFVLLFFVVLIVLSVLNQIEKEDRRDAYRESYRSASQPASFTWVNPSTSRTTLIPSIWSVENLSPADGMLYQFSLKSGRAVAVIGRQDFPGVTIQGYVDSFRQSNKATMDLPVGDFRTGSNGGSTWHSSGRGVALAGSVLDVEVRQIGSSFWRVVTMQVAPATSSVIAVLEVKKLLWATVPSR